MEHSEHKEGSKFAQLIAYPGRLCEDLGSREDVCTKHGAFTATGKRYAGKHDIWSDCPACVDEREKARLAAAAKLKEEQRISRLYSTLSSAGIPKRFVNKTLETFKATDEGQKRAFTLSKDFASDFDEKLKQGAWIVMSGAPGTGKSHLAIGILRDVLLTGRRGAYMTCTQMIQTIRSTWRKDSEDGESDVIKALTDLDLLVVDEVGVQFGTDSEQNHIFDVLDSRYREMRPTIILTNMDKEGLKGFVGDRVFDRMTEVAKWVPFAWASYRTTARDDWDIAPDGYSARQWVVPKPDQHAGMI